MVFGREIYSLSLQFNVALEKVRRESGLKMEWPIFNKVHQILAHVDDVTFISQTNKVLE